MAGPREDPDRGFVTFPAEEAGATRRLRPESFSDHFSQARQFYLSQTPVEQAHIGDSFIFELSKCKRDAIRDRMVSSLRNVDEDLARYVSQGIGLNRLPARSKLARPLETLDPSPALSILSNNPETFTGRKLGVLVSNGADHVLLRKLHDGIKAANANMELVGPTITGVSDDAGGELSIDQTVDGGPSVLFDAVAIVVSESGGKDLAKSLTAHDSSPTLMPIARSSATSVRRLHFGSAGLLDLIDGGFVDLESDDVSTFLSQCQQLRFWDRVTKGTTA